MSTRSLLDPGSGRERIIPIGFTVTFNHASPEMAQAVAEGLMKAFIEIGRSDQLLAASTRSEFFTSEAERVRRQIADLEGQLAEFKSANFDRLPEAAQAKLGTRARLEQELDNVDREIRTLQQNRVFVVQQLRQAQEGTMGANLRELEEEYARRSAVYAETHPDVVALRRQIESLKSGGTVATGNTLQAQLEQQQAVLAEARQRYSEDHPDVRRLVRDIEALEARIAADGTSPIQARDTLLSVQLRTQLNATDTQIGGLQSRASTLRQRLAELDEQLGATPEVEREYQGIARGLGSARDQYNHMIAKRLDADAEVVAINSGAADRFTLFAAPTLPWQPSGPPRAGIFVVGVMLSFMISLPLALLAELVDVTLRGARDVRTLLGHAPIAAIPDIRSATVRRRSRNRFAVLAACAAAGATALFYVVRLVASS